MAANDGAGDITAPPPQAADGSSSGGSRNGSSLTPFQEEVIDSFRDNGLAPLVTGVFQGFFSVAFEYYKERKRARKEIREAAEAAAAIEAIGDPVEVEIEVGAGALAALGDTGGLTDIKGIEIGS